MVNKRLLFIGAIIALVFGGAIFTLSYSKGADPPLEVLAAREDIPAGTRINSIPDEALARIPLTGDNTLLGAYLTEPTWQKIQAAGGVVVQDIYQYEAVPLSAIASDGNPKQVDVPRLGLTNPDLVVVSLSSVSVPNDIRAGDHVDLVVAVERARNETLTLVAPQPGTMLAEEAGETDMGEMGMGDTAGTPPPSPTLTATRQPTHTPTPSPTPTLSPFYPLAKVIVRAARVAEVRRAQPVAGAGDQIVLGEVTGVDVIIPRQAQEFVLMSDTAGQLGLSLLSPMLERETDQGPTLGAHFEDLLDLFAADRQALSDLDNDGP